MATLTVHRKAYKRKPYTRKDGTRVAGSSVESSTLKVKDRGKKGRTPKSERWYNPKVKTGWRKEDSQETRIRHLVKAHGGDLLASARSAQALANVTTDRETKQKASSDARVLFARHNKS